MYLYQRREKLNALAILCKFLPFNKCRVLMKDFVINQFATSPLLGMFVDRNINSKINALHYLALRIVYHDTIASFEDLLVKDRSLTVHHRNMYGLAIEMLKDKNIYSARMLTS